MCQGGWGSKIKLSLNSLCVRCPHGSSCTERYEWFIKKRKGEESKRLTSIIKNGFFVKSCLRTKRRLWLSQNFAQWQNKRYITLFFPSQKLKKKSSSFFTRFPKNFSCQNFQKKKRWNTSHLFCFHKLYCIHFW